MIEDSAAREPWRWPYRLADQMPSSNGLRAAGSSPSTGGEGAANSRFLLESGDFLLMESGDKLLLE